MSGSKQLRLVSFFIIFIFFTSLLFVAVNNADASIIVGPNQMSLGETQTLTITCSGGPYIWTITSGGGNLSAASGNSVNYTAPATNPNCDNTVISVSYNGRVLDTLRIYVTNPNLGSAAYIECRNVYGVYPELYCVRGFNCKGVNGHGTIDGIFGSSAHCGT
jgi:hypothetical protein